MKQSSFRTHRRYVRMKNLDWKWTLIHVNLLLFLLSSYFVQPSPDCIVFILFEPQIYFTGIFRTKLYFGLWKSIWQGNSLLGVGQSKFHGILVEPKVDIKFLLGFNEDDLREKALIIDSPIDEPFEHRIYPDWSDRCLSLSP